MLFVQKLTKRPSSGVGVAAGTVTSGELARITTVKERTAVYTLCQAVTQIGYMLGKDAMQEQTKQ